MDVLSDLLRVVKLNGALFLDAELREPWCVNAPSGADLAPILAPGAQQLAICHLVVSGCCWSQVPGQAPVLLEAGQVVVLPHGHYHQIGCGLNGGPINESDLVELDLPELSQPTYGGRGAPTRLICGWFAYEHRIAAPLTGALPTMFAARIRGRPSGVWLEPAIHYAVQEASSAKPGGAAMASHLAEILFLEALRDYIEHIPGTATGWLAGLRDATVGRCLALMHERPTKPWTLATLAQASHVSRTVLADRFSTLVGMPPMKYLKRWRLALAASMLRSGRTGLVRIAEQVGYESEAALSRAFKAEYGKPPGAWRREAVARPWD